MNEDILENSVNKRGGSREGAGRRVGTGKFHESTTVLRIPESQAPVIKDFLAAYQRKKLSSNLDTVTDFDLPPIILSSIELPLFSSKVSAGFPSPAAYSYPKEPLIIAAKRSPITVPKRPLITIAKKPLPILNQAVAFVYIITDYPTTKVSKRVTYA